MIITGNLRPLKDGDRATNRKGEGRGEGGRTRASAITSRAHKNPFSCMNDVHRSSSLPCLDASPKFTSSCGGAKCPPGPCPGPAPAPPGVGGCEPGYPAPPAVYRCMISALGAPEPCPGKPVAFPP